ncbi:YlbF family regulator [Staphylococcus canis]|uniref:YlbF family regulator n=1 Tax=Staphylococcus canis TaxID=2724942 RepID=A0ABS0T6W7_9STAP|nr:YlbF family regulator [Staphylococcus canis]MBI5974492.1 YlbF family regulator [Staphylococcus canis]
MFDSEVMQILDEVDNLADMIQDSQIFQQYEKAKETLENDTEAKALYRDFMKIRDQYTDVQRFGRYHPDYQKIMLETRRKKRAYEMHDTVVQFKQKETELQKLLDEVASIIASSISSHVKVDAGSPFAKNQIGCGCGSGGQCGCSVG